MAAKREYRKSQRTPEQLADLRTERERYQKEKPTIEDIESRGGTILPLREVLFLHQMGIRFREERLKQQLSLTEVAHRAGIDEPALSRIETGRNANPTVDTLNRIAEALGKIIAFELQDKVAS